MQPLSAKPLSKADRNEKSVYLKLPATAVAQSRGKAVRHNKSDSDDSDDSGGKSEDDDDDDDGDDDDDNNSCDDSAESEDDSRRDKEVDSGKKDVCVTISKLKHIDVSRSSRSRNQVSSEPPAVKRAVPDEGQCLDRAQTQLLVHKVFELENTISKLKQELSEKVNYCYLLSIYAHFILII